MTAPTTLRPLPPVAVVLERLADHLDLQPSRPVDMARVRVRARALGLASDWITLLPTPDDTHHSAYAARLREIAGAGR